MFSIIKQVFIVSLSFSESLSTKCVPLNDEPCMVRPTLKYYPFIISLDKCNRICNVFSKNMCSENKTKDINVKVFNMIKNKY